jgi:hypothetical protein
MDLMKSLLKSVKSWIGKQAKRAAMSDEERYLSDSIDLADFEARQQKIMYGQAPHQINSRHWLDARSYQ